MFVFRPWRFETMFAVGTLFFHKHGAEDLIFKASIFNPRPSADNY